MEEKVDTRTKEEKKQTPPKVFSIQIIDDEVEGVSVMINKSDGMTELEMLGHLEYVKGSILNTMLKKTKQIEKKKEEEKVNVDLDGQVIPKFDNSSSTL